MYLHDETIQQMVETNDTASWRIAGQSGVEIFSVEEMVCLLAIEPPKKDDATTRNGMLRVGLATQSVIEKAKSQ